MAEYAALPKVRARERPPLGALPVEPVDVHHDTRAKNPAQRGVVAHPDVDEEKEIVAADDERVKRSEKRRNQSREILSARRWHVLEPHSLVLGNAQGFRIVAAAAVDRHLVPRGDEARRDLAEGGLESGEVKLRERHAVESEHADAKALWRALGHDRRG